MFKVEDGVTELQLNEGMVVKQLIGLFLGAKALNYFVVQSKVKQHAIHMKED
jgi:hypothetical protein